MHTHLQGRKIPVDQSLRRPPRELLHLIRKLRWLGMEEEAEDLHAKLKKRRRPEGCSPSCAKRTRQIKLNL
jgi:hypothetical protein